MASKSSDEYTQNNFRDFPRSISVIFRGIFPCSSSALFRVRERGQVLLITIMLLATVLTVVLAVTFKSTTETQLTKLEEDSQKALAAAEAGVEVALKQNVGDSVPIASLPNFSGTGFTGEATVGVIQDTKFVSPLLQKDQQYTLYLSDYPSYTNPLNSNLTVSFMSEQQACPGPALELTFVSTTNTVTRRLVDPCNQIDKPSQDLGTTANPPPLGGYSFAYKTDSIPVSSQAILIVRTLSASTRVGLEAQATLPAQGKYVTSEAKHPSGVSKKVQLFQSYPQIPAEFFVTSF